MVVAAFIFGIGILFVSVFFLLNYIRTNRFMQQNRHFLSRQQQLQSKLQADLQARIEADTRRFAEARRALLERASGDAKRPDAGRIA